MKKKKIALANYYNKNEDTSSYMIEISLDNYSELFNGWDASPLKRRDLEPELLDYIEQCGSEIPLEYSIELYLYLPESLKDVEKEQRSKTGILNNFNIVLFFIKRSLKKIHRQILINIIISIMFLISAYFFRNVIQIKDVFSSIFTEGLYIGGWVLLWEAFSLFFFESYEIKQRRKLFLRFVDMRIYFKYIDDQKTSVGLYNER